MTKVKKFNAGKKGKWIVNSDGYYPQCSLCYFEPARTFEERLPTYCPNCGARLKGNK